MFRGIGWPDAGRTLNESRDGNCGDLVHVKPFAAQMKCGAAPSPWRALREAVAAADPGDYPVAILKRNGEKPVVVQPLEDWAELVGKLKAFGIL